MRFIYHMKLLKLGLSCSFCGEGADELFLGYSRIFSSFYNKPLILLSSINCIDILLFKSLFNLSEGSDYDSIRSFFFQFHLKGLLRVDRMTMHSGLESRVPFLHNDLVDYILSCNLDSFILRESKLM